MAVSLVRAMVRGGVGVAVAPVGKMVASVGCSVYDGRRVGARRFGLHMYDTLGAAGRGGAEGVSATLGKVGEVRPAVVIRIAAAAGDVHRNGGGYAVESIHSDPWRGVCLRSDAGESAAIFECIIADAGYGIRDGNAGDAAAVVKSGIADTCYEIGLTVVSDRGRDGQRTRRLRESVPGVIAKMGRSDRG